MQLARVTTDDGLLADPHVQVGLVAGRRRPAHLALHTRLLLAKEYATTGARIPAERAVAMGLANHVVADPLAEAMPCAKRIAGLPRQAAESSKRPCGRMPLTTGHTGGADAGS
jgi:enoyl-CoA hydratase